MYPKIIYRCFFGWHKWRYDTEKFDVIPKRYSPYYMRIRECELCGKRQRPVRIIAGEWTDIK